MEDDRFADKVLAQAEGAPCKPMGVAYLKEIVLREFDCTLAALGTRSQRRSTGSGARFAGVACGADGCGNPDGGREMDRAGCRNHERGGAPAWRTSKANAGGARIERALAEGIVKAGSLTPWENTAPAS